MSDEVVQEVQKAATVGDIVKDHIAGVGGYAIAEKYGIDPDKVKLIINEADARGAFIPEGVEPSVDSLVEPVIQPLPEGQNPEIASTKGHK